jgi:hypothetical protein
MIILTAANADRAKDDLGRFYKRFSYRGVITGTVRTAEKFGYTPVVYDLGSLGIGEPYKVNDGYFQNKGHYQVKLGKGYKSKSLFKPDIVDSCLSRYDSPVVYLDGDAELCGNIDEIDTEDYDVGVTLRDAVELNGEWYRDHFEIVKYLNAGVIFFRPTKEAKLFIRNWRGMTSEMGNDQMALNKLACPDEYPEAFSVLKTQELRIKFFPCLTYNFYYFRDKLSRGVKIMHFKADVRDFYPFNWRKRLYCEVIAPLVRKMASIRKTIKAAK